MELLTKPYFSAMGGRKLRLDVYQKNKERKMKKQRKMLRLKELEAKKKLCLTVSIPLTTFTHSQLSTLEQLASRLTAHHFKLCPLHLWFCATSG